jgi:uncharacterized protein YidB (DUF937 family)
LGGLLAGGVGNLIRDLQKSGNGQAAQSWVSNGSNQPITPGSLEAAVGHEMLDAPAKQTGMQRADLLGELSRHLPDFIDRLTPNGRLPTQEEASRMV